MTSFAARPQARRRFLLGLASSLVLALAGCQMGRGPINRPVEGPPPPPGGVVPTEERNRVAVVVPLTGADGAVGQSIANAATLALLDSGDRTLRLTTYNSAGAGGVEAATEKAIGEGNGLILGPLLADEVRAAAPIARRAGVPLIAFSNDEGVAGNGTYILGFTPNQSIERVVGLARQKGMARFGALVPTGLYGQRAAQAMLESVRERGGRMVALETYNRTATGVRGAAAALKAKGATDAVLIADAGRIAAVAAPSLKAGGKLLGTELWATDHALGATPALRGAWYAAAPEMRFTQLSTRYKVHYGKPPFRIASLGYDAVLLAVRSSRDWPIGGRFPVTLLRDRDGFAGVDGIFRFDRRGVAQRALEIRQVTAGGTTVVSPAAKVFGD
jgi:ABC-type branched-subunit amino acid transport system substrate-binding protein